jgi:hypothetical protein
VRVIGSDVKIWFQLLMEKTKGSQIWAYVNATVFGVQTVFI